ncbi:MAG: hypothetical protein AAF570_14695, partial [Bacteroidota bacterium]
GDAAIAFDPLSSHGISNAVYLSWRAAETITEVLRTGQTVPLQQYAVATYRIFEAYLKGRAGLHARKSPTGTPTVQYAPGSPM